MVEESQAEDDDTPTEPAGPEGLTAEPEPEPAAEPETPEPEPEAEPTEPEPEPTASEPEPEATEPEADATGHEPEAEPAAPPPPVQRTVAREIARQLHGAGTRFCFTVPAEPILVLLDALEAEGIRIITTRHEGGASLMAEALAQATGRPQVVAVSRAVGATNAAIGVHTATADSAPLVVLAGQVRSDLLGREAFQEADLVASIGSLARWAAQVDDPAQAAGVLARAWRGLQVGRPGPILLSLPTDVQSALIEVPDAPQLASQARGPAADRGDVSRALKLLAASERGIIVAGAGVLRARATKRLVALSEAMAVPVMAAWRRPDVFPNGHPNYLGMTGAWAARTVLPRLADADVIMFIGTRLSEVATGGYEVPGPQTRWIHVDVEPRHAPGRPAATLSITADASRFLDSAWSDLRAAALDNEMRSRREVRLAADREAYVQACRAGEGEWDGPGVHPGRILEILRAALPDNATIASDAGNLAGWLARWFPFRRAGTFLGATSGTMGFGLPAAIAASLSDPDRIAIAVCGDGGFAVSMSELETAVREGAHPIAIVFDDQRYGTVALQQSREGRATASTDLGPIDFAAVARAMGARGFTVSETAEFEPALREAITSREPSVIHVHVDRAWRSVDEHPLSEAG